MASLHELVIVFVCIFIASSLSKSINENIEVADFHDEDPNYIVKMGSVSRPSDIQLVANLTHGFVTMERLLENNAVSVSSLPQILDILRENNKTCQILEDSSSQTSRNVFQIINQLDRQTQLMEKMISSSETSRLATQIISKLDRQNQVIETITSSLSTLNSHIFNQIKRQDVLMALEWDYRSNLRLEGGNSLYEGRVIIRYNGRWGTICDDSEDHDIAKVVCRQLGFPGYHDSIFHSSTTFGTGRDLTIWLDNVQCTGTEDSLDNCTHNGWGVHNCGHDEDVGVSCM